MQFGQNCLCVSIRFKEFNDPVAFSKLHESKKYAVSYVSVLTEKRVDIHCKHQLEDDSVTANLTIFLACFTTCWAPVRLWTSFKGRCYTLTLTVRFLEVCRDKSSHSQATISENSRMSSATMTAHCQVCFGQPQELWLPKRRQGFSLNTEGSKQWSYQVPTTELPGRHSRAVRIQSKAYQMQ